MKNTLRQIFHSGKFVVGFCIMAAMLLMMLIYPLLNPGSPLENIGVNSFSKPGTYLSLYDAADVMKYTFNLSDAEQKRIDSKLLPADRVSMREWLLQAGIAEEAIDIENTEDLITLWNNNFDPEIRMPGATQAVRRAYVRLDAKLDGLLDTYPLVVYTKQPSTQEPEDEVDSSEQPSVLDQLANKPSLLDQLPGSSSAAASNSSGSSASSSTSTVEEVLKTEIIGSDYVNLEDVANKKSLPLGTDNFGRDVLKQLVSAAATSMRMGVIAGVIATLIGLTLGLLAGYVGGIVDDIIMFVNNCFTVIPSFILLILISYSIGQEQRGATTVAIVIGCTSWVWTSRSVRSQVISLRNRDHVNLSKLSGHSMPRIIVTDILPYIASYVVMAFILQMSSAILAEAQLSMLSLGPKTTEIPTLGLMMNWAMKFAAHLNGYWWAYYPVLFSIAFISFSLNLMNTGLDQVFNPQLRD